ncbi:MAG: hypothetical protein ABSF60_08095 [Verrucomicrobiota bacterium]
MATNSFATNVAQEATKALTGNVVDPIWLQVLNSNLAAALIGFLAALLIWRLTEWSQAKRKKRDNEMEYLALLRAVQNELIFYKNKFGFLSNQIGEAIKAAMQGRPAARPSYSFYPAFLERAKQDLCSFFKNEELVRELGHCYFELCHIVERVEWYKSVQAERLVFEVNNIQGVKALIDSNIPVFERTAQLFAEEEKQVRNALN